MMIAFAASAALGCQEPLSILYKIGQNLAGIDILY